ncbi:hypothetical protein [Saccharopolyspora erythraea]|uniref:hypothetical protein n=1 Tax=Saccharopolyspora erythraea TaxID=1836 RepID=UPI003D801DC0
MSGNHHDGSRLSLSSSTNGTYPKVSTRNFDIPAREKEPEMNASPASDRLRVHDPGWHHCGPCTESLPPTFRKTAATTLDEAGLTARLIADQLGHSRPSMTQDVYMGRKAVSRQAASALEQAWDA